MPTTRMRHPQPPVTYQPAAVRRGPVEREMVARRLAPTEGAAFQKLVRLRAFLPQLYECFVEARASERLAWFTEPAEEVLERTPTDELSPEILIDAIRLDGKEDGELAALLAHLGDEAVARATARLIYAEMATKRRVLRAMSRRHGWTL